MWEYKITKSDLGYNIFRVKEEDGIEIKERLQKDNYTLNRNFARTFYHLNDAMSALVIAKSKGEKISTTSTQKFELEKRGEKTSWSEL